MSNRSWLLAGCLGAVLCGGIAAAVAQDGGKGEKSATGLVPLTELTGKYQGEDGGLYGGGKNDPPEAHRAAAEKELARVAPLDAVGKLSKDGTVVLVSISMSNATQEFSAFKRVADADADKSPRLTIVDCAQGGRWSFR